MPAKPPTPFDRLLAVDLRDAREEDMRALSAEAIQRGCSLQDLLAQLILETARRIAGPAAQPQTAA